MSAGIPIRPSTTRPAAARCSTWAPTTSPISSTCSARSPSCGLCHDAARGHAPITSEPRNGETHSRSHVPTHVAGMLDFANGAVVQIAMSFDVAGHKHVPLEIYGTEGTLIVPDPNLSAARSNI